MEFGEPASCKLSRRVLLVGARRDGGLCEHKLLMNENCNTMIQQMVLVSVRRDEATNF